ncbi:MAG: pyrroline-5-carboxylate reductase [Planctomycetota bacterium]|nr:MAG: pyrroline-5-carboxylate reductase [Planctomycetota bacterium]
MTTSVGVDLAVIGGGTMACAILRGAFDAGILEPGRVVVAEPAPERRSALADLGCATVARAGGLDAQLPTGARVLLAVKPQMLAQVAQELAGRARGRCVISVLAGVTLARLEGALGPGLRAIRTMPNLPARVGRGITAIAPSAGVGEDDAAFCRRLFGSVGQTIDLPEDLIDAFTGVAGSGPAYVFYLAEAMLAGADAVGLPPDQAGRIVRATIAGASALLDTDDADPAALRAAVTSKKGTTDAAIRTLERAGVRDAVVRAIVAARDRGRELADP